VRSVDPSSTRAVRVLVAEAAEPPVPLSGILEAAGLRVVGRAATPAELERLLSVTKPEVVVFDGEMSAETVATTRSSEPSVGIVLVWPEGAAAGPAQEHVSPARVRRDLAAAARRAAPLRGAGAVPTPVQATAPLAPTGAEPGQKRRGAVELLVAAVLTFLLVLSSIIFRITEGGGGIFARGPVASTLPVPPGNLSGDGVSPPEAPSNASTDTGVVPVVNALLAPADGSGTGGPTFGSNRGAGDNGTGGSGGTGGDGTGGDGTGGDGGGGVSRRAAACNAAADVDTASTSLSTAIAKVLENCLGNTESRGLLNALTHLGANAQRRAEHDGTERGSGHGRPHTPARCARRGGSPARVSSATHGHSHGHGPTGSHGRSGDHASGKAHHGSSDHGHPNH
jgi:hypothetical protein